MKENLFPVFKNENFLSEAIVWSAISEKNNKLVFIPKGIYICEYLNDGLTKAGRKKQLDNPQGFYLHAKSFMTKKLGGRLDINIQFYLLPHLNLQIKQANKFLMIVILNLN